MKFKKVFLVVVTIALAGILWKAMYDIAFDVGFQEGYRQQIEVQSALDEFVEP